MYVECCCYKPTPCVGLQLLDEAESTSVRGRQVQLTGLPQPLVLAANAIVLKLRAANGCPTEEPAASADACTWSYLHPQTVRNTPHNSVYRVPY